MKCANCEKEITYNNLECKCGEIYCHDCYKELEKCEICDEKVCDNCSIQCEICGNSFCSEHSEYITKFVCVDCRRGDIE